MICYAFSDLGKGKATDATADDKDVRSGHTEILDGNETDSMDERAFVYDKMTLKEGGACS